MKTPKSLLLTALLLTFMSCGQNNSYSPSADMNYEQVVAPATNEALEEEQQRPASEYVSSAAAVDVSTESERKFIRLADLKFKVKDVINTTYRIEAITLRHGGFVTYTNLASRINQVKETAISADSTLETTYYTVYNSMTIRVPVAKLDTTLKDISRSIDFLDRRIIQAEDVAIKILSNKLAQRRAEQTEKRMATAVDNQGKKLKETLSAEELLARKQEQADNAMLANLTMADQISYSTITIYLYQRPSIRREVLANDKNIDEYKPGFGKNLLSALKTGWDTLKDIVVFLIEIWWFFLFVIMGYYGYKWLRKSGKKQE